MKADKGWQRRFDDPIFLQDGRQLVTLQDAGNYIAKLPKAEQQIGSEGERTNEAKKAIVSSRRRQPGAE